MLAAGILIVAAMAMLGALWSGSPAGRNFAETLSSTYDSGWLAWASCFVWLACGVGILFASKFARILYLVWSAWGIVEGLTLLSETRFSLPSAGLFAVTAILLFLPPSNAWFRGD